MATYSSRGQVLYKDVLNLESSILRSPKINKNVEKQVESLELKLSSIRSDFEREAKILVSRIASNKRSNQNIVNRSNKVKAVKVSEMNRAINKIRKLSTSTSAPAPAPALAPAPAPSSTSGQSSSSVSELMSTLEKINGKLESMGPRFKK